MTVAPPLTTGAESVRWNLNDLYLAPDDPQIAQGREALRAAAQAFAEKYRGRVAQLSAAEMLEALQTYEANTALAKRLITYPHLAWTTATQDATWGKLLAQSREFLNEINQVVLFFELEWTNAPEEPAQALINDPALAHYQHYLRMERLYQPHTLSEPEEKLMSELSLTGMQAWSRFFGEVMSRIEFQIGEERLTQSQVLNRLEDPDRQVRQQAANAMTEGLRTHLHTTAFVYNTMLADKASRDRLRGFESWIASRNLANQIEDSMVDALVNAVTSRYDIVWRYYALIKQFLGYDELFDYDRYAPVLEVKQHVSWPDAQATVLEAFGAFSPRMAEIAQLFFDHHWIDAAPVQGKRGGAYSASVSAAIHPYIFMNYLGDQDNVMTLAHELGHGVHQYLGRDQGELMNSTPLTTAEMASTFGEMLVFDHLIQRQTDPQVRVAMRLGKILDVIKTVFRQTAMNRFEDRIHTLRREQGELSAKQLNATWLETQRACMAPASPCARIMACGGATSRT
ncbi:MAG: M3 family oligoendopeptidase [Anaerolineae bacterium]|nr:M3 family oligoendopeptidase [Anaerolineae bacterium]